MSSSEANDARSRRQALALFALAGVVLVSAVYLAVQVFRAQSFGVEEIGGAVAFAAAPLGIGSYGWFQARRRRQRLAQAGWALATALGVASVLAFAIRGIGADRQADEQTLTACVANVLREVPAQSKALDARFDAIAIHSALTPQTMLSPAAVAIARGKIDAFEATVTTRDAMLVALQARANDCVANAKDRDYGRLYLNGLREGEAKAAARNARLSSAQRQLMALTRQVLALADTHPDAFKQRAGQLQISDAAVREQLAALLQQSDAAAREEAAANDALALADRQRLQVQPPGP